MAKEGRFDRYCTVCGKHYEYCPTCSRFSHMERWHDAYCCANCKDLYNVTAGFINHWQEPEVEATRLQKLDLSYKNKLPAWMQAAIRDIQHVELNSVDAAVVEEVVAEPVAEVVVEDIKEEVKEDKEVEKAETEEKNVTAQLHKFEKKVNTQNKYKPNKFGK